MLASPLDLFWCVTQAITIMLEQPKAEKVQNGDFFYVFEKLLYSVHFNSVNLYDMTISRLFFQYWTQLNRVILSSWKILEYYINKTMFFCREKLQRYKKNMIGKT